MTSHRRDHPAHALVIALVVAGSTLAHPSPAGAQGGQRLEAVLRAVTADVADVTVDAAGLTRAGERLWSVEPTARADESRPKVVLVGGLDGQPSGAATVVRLLQWWYRDPEAAPLRRRWQLAAVACARPGLCDADAAPADAPALAFPPPGGFFDGKLDPTPHHLWRWVTPAGADPGNRGRHGRGRGGGGPTAWPATWFRRSRHRAGCRSSVSRLPGR